MDILDVNGCDNIIPASNLLRVDYFQQFHEGVCDF